MPGTSATTLQLVPSSVPGLEALEATFHLTAIRQLAVCLPEFSKYTEVLATMRLATTEEIRVNS